MKTSSLRTLALSALTTLTVGGSLLVAAAPAQADDRYCRGTIGATYVDGNVIVPKGATCRLLGTRVDGNVEVKRNATLIARGVRVDGNIQGENHRAVTVRARKVGDTWKRSRVEGNIQVKQGGGGKLLRTVVGGDIQVFSNTARFTIRGNIVDGNLQCKSNKPRPVGANNRVEGNKEGQCKGK